MDSRISPRNTRSDAIFRNAVDIYRHMEKYAVDGIWEGKTTELFDACGVSVGKYSLVFNALKSMGCIEQLTRGGGNLQSQWRVLYPPELEIYLAKKNTGEIRGSSKSEVLEHRVLNLQLKLDKLESNYVDLMQLVQQLWNELHGVKNGNMG